MSWEHYGVQTSLGEGPEERWALRCDGCGWCLETTDAVDPEAFVESTEANLGWACELRGGVDLCQTCWLAATAWLGGYWPKAIPVRNGPLEPVRMFTDVLDFQALATKVLQEMADAMELPL